MSVSVLVLTGAMAKDGAISVQSQSAGEQGEDPSGWHGE